jgi:hypothetical protein
MSQRKDGKITKVRLILLPLLAWAAMALLVLGSAAYAQQTATLLAAARSPEKPSDKSLASCPARKPALRIAGHFNEEFTPHPAENRFASTQYTRLHQMPLFGTDPGEANVDAAFGVAEAWEFLPGAKGLNVTLREGLTFNNATLSPLRM